MCSTQGRDYGAGEASSKSSDSETRDGSWVFSGPNSELRGSRSSGLEGRLKADRRRAVFRVALDRLRHPKRERYIPRMRRAHASLPILALLLALRAVACSPNTAT